MEAKEPNSGNKHWDASGIYLGVTNTQAWSIPKKQQDLFKQLIKVVLSTSNYDPDLPITFSQFKTVIAFLYDRGYFTGSLEQAIERAGADVLNNPVPAPPISPDTTRDIEHRTFKNKWVYVVGTARNKLSAALAQAGTVVGKTLAREGYGLITGGWPGVDRVCSAAYIQEWAGVDVVEKEYLLQIVARTNESDSPYGKKVFIGKGERFYDYPLEKAFAVVLIGGVYGTRTAFNAAKAKNIPVIPISSTNGETERVFKELKKKAYHYPIDLVSPESLPLTPSHEAATIKRLQEVLALLDPPQPVASEKSFRRRVNQLYKERKVVVPDDPQKNRWGGKNSRDGHKLLASVTKDGASSFTVALLVMFDTDKKRSDKEVAFFVHDTFDKEIEFRRIKDGSAHMELVAYEAFTAAAYLEDGTTLELDLNETPGFPKDFYYKLTLKDFKDNIKILLKQSPILVKEDMQKNRWGNNKILNNKRLSAKLIKAMAKGQYSIALQVHSTDPSIPLKGNVAFFLPDKPNNPIYQQVTNGLAETTLISSRAFTVGVYCQDGTMLEMDLQDEEGLPEGFYRRNAD